METSKKNRFFLSLLLLAGLSAAAVTVSPLYAMKLAVGDNDDESESKSASEVVWDLSKYCADSVMHQVSRIPVVGKALGREYFRPFCYHKSYQETCRLGDPVLNNDGEVIDADQSGSELKLIGGGTVGEKKCWFGATREGDTAYWFSSYDEKTKKLTGKYEELKTHDFNVIFDYGTLLYKSFGELGLKNKRGHVLVMRQKEDERVPVITNSGKLIFTHRGQYFDYEGNELPLSIDDIGRLPTLYKKKNPVVAVATVLVGTVITVMGTAVVLWKAAKRGRNKICSNDQKDKKGDDNKNVNSGVGSDVKNEISEKQEPVQTQDHKTDTAVKESVQECELPKAAAHVETDVKSSEKQKEHNAQSQVQIDRKPMHVIPERPRPGIARIATAQPISPTRLSPYSPTSQQDSRPTISSIARANDQQKRVHRFGHAR